MTRFRIDTLGLSEIRLKGRGRINSENTTVIYSGVDCPSRGVGIMLKKVVAAAFIGNCATSYRKIRG